MPFKDKQKEKEYWKEYARKWRAKNSQKYKETMKLWREKNKHKVKEYRRKHYYLNREKEILRHVKGNLKRHRQLRLRALIYYGGCPPKCTCCKEWRMPFLTIDHIYGNGGKHRKEIKRYGTLYEWLKRMNYPKGFTVLCMNCNWGKRLGEQCPHKEERDFSSEKETSQSNFSNILN